MAVTVSASIFVHIVWMDYRDGNYEIYYKRSTNAGINWGPDTRLTNNSADSFNPSISLTYLAGSVIHVVWHDYRDGNSEIYYKRSSDGGSTWGSDTRLTNSSFESFSPSVANSGSTIHVCWHDNRNGNYEVYYKRSADGGISWGTDTRLTIQNDPSMLSSIASDGLNISIVWRDNRDANNEIYFKRSVDGGINWGTDTRLTTNYAISDYPAVTISGSIVHVVWDDQRDANDEIYYKRSTDLGLNWEPDTRLTNAALVSDRAFISVSGQVVHIVWHDYRDGNAEIYYKINPTGSAVGLSSVHSELPVESRLEQNYPNPFNPVTNFRFRIHEYNLVNLTIYDVSGKEKAIIVNEKLNPGIYEMQWDASAYPGGVYFYRLVSGSYSQTRKLALIK